MSRLRSALHELRRRNVIRAGVAYVASGWFVVQIANVFVPTLDAPGWVLQALLVVVALGLPAVLAFSWFFEITADGIVRTEDLPPAVDPPHQLFDRRMDFVVIGILAGALSLSLYGNFRSDDAPPEPISILIADFENATGTELFTGVLEETLRIGLEVAPFVEIFSRNAAAAIAAGLGGDAASESRALDLETAGLVALRESVNLVIGGRIDRNDDGLVLSVRGIAPGERRELFSATASATSDADVLRAIADVSEEARYALGDTPKPGRAGELESFAVGNLEAAAEYLTAQELQLNRELEQAVVHYERALELDPNFARAYAGLALTEEYLGRTEAARAHWEAALSRLDQLTERGRLRTLGSYYTISQRDYENALETYERLVERYPADNVAQNNLAVAAFSALDFERALEVGRAIASRFPEHSGYRANLALYAMYAGNFGEASAVAAAVIDDEPRSVYAHIVLALTQAVAGDLDAAEARYRRMTELDQFGRSVALEGLADLALVRGDAAEAVAILDAAIEEELARDANQTAALKQVMRAGALLRLGDPGEARRAVDAALELAGGDPAALVPASLALIELEASDRAESIATDLQRSPSRSLRAYASAIRAEVAAARGDLDTAIEHADSAVAAADLWLIRYLRGNMLLRAGRVTEGVADLRVCETRVGEALAVFLNDRPTLRWLQALEADLAELSGGAVRAGDTRLPRLVARAGSSRPGPALR